MGGGEEREERESGERGIGGRVRGKWTVQQPPKDERT